MDIMPDETYKKEFKKKIRIGTKVRITMDSQYNDNTERCFGKVGTVVEMDPGDEWAYKIAFDGTENWFKRHCFTVERY